MGCFNSKQKEQASEMIGKGVSLRITQRPVHEAALCPALLRFYETLSLLQEGKRASAC